MELTTVPDTPPHVPVLLDRIVGLLADAPDGPVVDATLGAGGHAHAVAAARRDRYGHATLVGLDRDPDALELARDRLAELGDTVTVHLVRTRFDGLRATLDELGIDRVSGVLFDLGISSMHVDRAERGFSYRQDGPLDMRMGPDATRTAAELVNEADLGELRHVLRTYGEEPMADRIARAIVDQRPHTTTTELAEVVRDAIPAARRRTGGHPATRTFQALRIAVNGELDALAAVLPDALEALAPGGVAVSLSYHSLEDRLVKRAFTDAARGCICPPGLPVCACGRVPLVTPLVRKPERPDAAEIAANPRASAARLRAVRREPDASPAPTDPTENPTEHPREDHP
ncbi:16S rRNA (cytosine(1402)-N(4))-methyltransferase RsmH [Nitriliruptoraceae bacterium ZYF776]|nr:16S rRNA (cytosine(1402)-N(4))-methyltransferase RsmH [Profundirhabdus halotolerans]